MNITQQNELEIEIGDVWQEHETWVTRSRHADPIAKLKENWQVLIVIRILHNPMNSKHIGIWGNKHRGFLMAKIGLVVFEDTVLWEIFIFLCLPILRVLKNRLIFIEMFYRDTSEFWHSCLTEIWSWLECIRNILMKLMQNMM